MSIEYPNYFLPELCYQFCPMCKTELTEKILSDDFLTRSVCPKCNWTFFPNNAIGVNVLVTSKDRIVCLVNPKNPSAIFFPGGHVEFGESPQTAAIREVFEETGLEIEIVNELGWYFSKNLKYPGPIVSFMYEANVIGGKVRESEEGKVLIFKSDELPPIANNRKGSQKLYQAYKISKGISS